MSFSSSRRFFSARAASLLLILGFLSACVSGPARLTVPPAPAVRFGVVTDSHYAVVVIDVAGKADINDPPSAVLFPGRK